MYKPKQRLVSVLVASSLGLFATNANAFTLKDGVSEVLTTNPVVQERLKNFYETQQDLNIAESEYLPSVDLISRFGHNRAGDLRSHITDVSYKHYTNSLKITQNLFNGFSTTNKVDYQKSRILAAAYHYVENANDIAFQLTGAYIDVIRGYRLLQNAKESVAINEKIYADVQELYDSGLTTKSEMTKIYAALSLSKSNLVVQQNNTIDKEFRLKRLLGRDVDVSQLELPSFDLAMPESLERATMYALQHNPSILVSNYNIEGAQSLYKERKSAFYPRVDLELEQLYNNAYSKSDNGYDNEDDRRRAYVTLSWNLYRGGADKAALQKTRSNIHKEVEIQRDLRRQTMEGLELSWSAYEMIALQLEQLYEYNKHSVDTLDSYQSEYEMGRRTLLDLLSAQNDLISSKSQIINAELDRLFAQYRILDAMGILVSTIAGETPEYNQLVKPTQNPFDIVEDTLPVSLDLDGDGIPDDLDICQSSIDNNDILPYGCSQKLKDSDFDGVPDDIDECADTPFGVIVDEKGCPIEGEANRFEAKADTYVNTPQKYTSESPVKSDNLGLYDYEYNPEASKHVPSTEKQNHLMYDSFETIKRYDAVNMNDFDGNLSQEQINYINQVASDIKKLENEDITVTVIGHTKTMSSAQSSYDASSAYAQAVKRELVANGIDDKVIYSEARMFQDLRFLETRVEDEALNERVAIALYVPKKEVVKEVFEEGIPIDLLVLFEHDSAVVLLESLDRVNNFKEYLLDHPHYRTVITGHTSKTPVSTFEYNMKLSIQRAEAIKKILVAGGIDPSRIETIGKSYMEPIATNDTLEGQAQNRRIIAELINTKPNETPQNTTKSTSNKKDSSSNWTLTY
ncbi:MAG: TolC family protein [Arcobacter butzleri]|nr:TolC family protein [Aliarcobacter butzleri]